MSMYKHTNQITTPITVPLQYNAMQCNVCMYTGCYIYIYIYIYIHTHMYTRMAEQFADDFLWCSSGVRKSVPLWIGDRECRFVSNSLVTCVRVCIYIYIYIHSWTCSGHPYFRVETSTYRQHIKQLCRFSVDILHHAASYYDMLWHVVLCFIEHEVQENASGPDSV